MLKTIYIMCFITIISINGCKQKKTEDASAAYTVDKNVNNVIITQQQQCDSQAGKVWADEHCVDLTQTQTNSMQLTETSTDCSVYTVFDGEHCVNASSPENFYRLCIVQQTITIKAILKQFSTTDCQIGYNQLKSTTSLDLKNLNISDLTSLSQLPNLHTIVLDGNPINSVAALANAANLYQISMQNTLLDPSSPKAVPRSSINCPQNAISPAIKAFCSQ